MSMDAAEAANIVEELGLQLYRLTDDTDALDDSIEVADYIRESNTSSKQETLPVEEQRVPYGEGYIVIDEDAPDWSDTPKVEVVEVTDMLAHQYQIDAFKTVSNENPAYPHDDVVVEARPINSDDTYAYPASRLRLP